MGLDLISVVIPTYNRPKETIEAVKTVLGQNGINQTFELEIIVVDDCSEASHVAQMIDAFQGKHVDIVTSERNSGGPAYPRNVGIHRAKGKWVAFLDSDDKWDIHKLETQLLRMREDDTKASGCVTISSESSVLIRIADRLVTAKKKITRRNLYLSNLLTASSLIISSEVIDSAGEFPIDRDSNFFEDYAYWLRVLTFTDVSVVSSNLVFYDMDGSDTRSSKVTDKSVALRNTFSNFDLWATERTEAKPKYIEKIFSRLQIVRG
jgi:glycosyltransferase involved in cell wall biosynthesis